MYGLNVCVPPEFICWNLDHQYNSTWRLVLREIIRSWGQSSHGAISVLIWRERTRAPSLYHVRIKQDCHLQTRKRALTRHKTAGTLILGIPVSTTVANKYILFKLPSLNKDRHVSGEFRLQRTKTAISHCLQMKRKLSVVWVLPILKSSPDYSSWCYFLD